MKMYIKVGEPQYDTSKEESIIWFVILGMYGKKYVGEESTGFPPLQSNQHPLKTDSISYW